MLQRKVTLIDIGAGGLPVVSAPPLTQARWFPTVHQAATTPPVTGLTPEPVVDGVLLQWEAVDQQGVVYIIERAPAADGPWTEIHRTSDTRYLYSDSSGQQWHFRVTASVRGKDGAGTVVQAVPVKAPSLTQLVEQQQRLDKEIADRVAADVAETQARGVAIAAETSARITAIAAEAALRVEQIRELGEEVSGVAADLLTEQAARAQAMLNEKAERQAEIAVERQTRQSGLESLALQIATVSAGSGAQFDFQRIYYFDTEAEGWTANGGAPVLANGWIRPANNTSPYLNSPAMGVDGSAYSTLKLRIRKVGTPVWRGLIRWTTEANPTVDDTRAVTIPEPVYDVNGIALVDVSEIPWGGASPVRQIRLALTNAQTAANFVEIDWVAAGRPTPGASVAMVQAETQARITAIAAEATQRNTLAVQLRGTYDGNSLGAVQTGFIADERNARVTADEAQVQRISAMEVRMPAGVGQLATSASVLEEQQARVTAMEAMSGTLTQTQATLQLMQLKGENAISDGSFENRAVGTPVGLAVVTDAAARTGSRSLRITGTGAIRDVNILDVRTNGSRVWYAEVWVRRDPVNPAASGQMQLAGSTWNTAGTVSYPLFRTQQIGGLTDEWRKLSGTVVLPEDATRLVIRASLRSDVAAGGVLWDDFFAKDITEAYNAQQVADATATGLQTMVTRVTSMEGTVTAQGAALTQVQTDLLGKASNAALSALQSTVTQQGATLTSQGSAITQLQGDVAGKASQSALSTLQATVTQQGNTLSSQGAALTQVQGALTNIGGDNLLGNSSFDDWTSTGGLPGWGVSSSGVGAGVVRRSSVPSTLPGSALAWRWEMDNVPTSGFLEGISSVAVKPAKAIPGQPVTLSAYVRGTPGARWFLQILWRDAAGGVISYNSGGVQTGFEETWSRKAFTSANAPANAFTVAVYIRAYGLHIAGQWVEWDNVQLEIGSVASGWRPSMEELQLQTVANASAASGLNTRLTNAEGVLSSTSAAMTQVQSAITRADRAGSNMLGDGSFEGRPAGTALASYAVISAGGRTGANGLHITSDAVARSVSLQTFDVSPGRTYYAEGWVRRAGAAGGLVQLRLNLSLNGANATFPYFGQVNVSAIPTDGFVKVSGYLTIPEGKNQAILQPYYNGNVPNGTVMQWDDLVLLDVTEGYGAQQTADAAANGLQAIQTTVTQQGGSIVAQGQLLSQMQVSIAGKAESGVVQLLEATVKGSMTGSGNLLANASFQYGVDGWGATYSPEGVTGPSRAVAAWSADPGVPTGMHALIVSGTANKAGSVNVYEQLVPVEAGKRYAFSAYASGSAAGYLAIEYVNAAGAVIGSAPAIAAAALPGGGASLASYTRLAMFFVPPTGTVRVRPILATRWAGAGNRFARWVRPMLEQAQATQDQPSPWAAGGAESSASYRLAVSAGGTVGGMTIGNDGGTVAVEFLSNIFRIISPAGADGYEMRDGYFRVWRGAAQRIIGTGFGVAADNLVDWFGPNVGAAQASKANATMWMDAAGNAYWGGSLAAGIRRNAVRTDTTQTVGTELLLGPFATNGNNKQVTISFYRSVGRMHTGMGNSGFNAGSGANTCTVQIYRSFNNGPESLWQTLTASGGVDISNEIDGPDTATSFWSGSMTVNDSDNGSQDRSYRAVVTAFGEQQVSHSTGSYDRQTISQTLSIVSIEL